MSPTITIRSDSEACGSITSIDALVCGNTSRTVAFVVLLSLSFIFFVGVMIQWHRRYISKGDYGYDIEAPRLSLTSTRTAHATNNGTINRKAAKAGNAWASMNERMKEVEQHKPSQYKRRTFPGVQVIINSRPLPGTNHTCTVKKLPAIMDPRTSESSIDSMETEHAYFVGQESGVQVREMV